VALLIGAGIVLLVFFFTAGQAKAQSSTRGPSELWQEYPLDPRSEQGASVSVESVRSVQGFRPTLIEPQRSSSDSMLLFAGLALVVLIIGDTSFLMLTRRALARADD
jgi:hypothetical protein